MALADRIRAAREQWVSAGGADFLIRRPTDLQISKLSGAPMSDLVLSSVVGWKLPEHELVPGGGGGVPPFDTEAFREWVGDRIPTLVELAKKVEDIIDQHNEKKKELEKN